MNLNDTENFKVLQRKESYNRLRSRDVWDISSSVLGTEGKNKITSETRIAMAKGRNCNS